LNELDNLPTPALILDLDVLERNIDGMARRADSLGVRLRPHVKTHKCIEVAEMQRRAGASALTVSTLHEASVFAAHGFEDITWAFPVILNRLTEAAELAGRIDLGLVIDSKEALDALASLPRRDDPLRVWLKIDCGYHRAGIDPVSERMLDIAKGVDSHDTLSLAGILTHSGHAYHAYGDEERQAVAEQERSVMVSAAARLEAAGIDVKEVSVGSTPAMTAARSLEGVTEARPGNYVFYDYMQCALGACDPRDVAVSVLSSVISRMPSHSVVDAGALAMSKDPGPERNGAGMGPVMTNDGSVDPDTRLLSVSQEHGILSASLPVGTKVRIVPNHSCLTVACFDEYHVVRGNELVGRWKIHRGR